MDVVMAVNGQAGLPVFNQIAQRRGAYRVILSGKAGTGGGFVADKDVEGPVHQTLECRPAAVVRLPFLRRIGFRRPTATNKSYSSRPECDNFTVRYTRQTRKKWISQGIEVFIVPLAEIG